MLGILTKKTWFKNGFLYYFSSSWVSLKMIPTPGAHFLFSASSCCKLNAGLVERLYFGNCHQQLMTHLDETLQVYCYDLSYDVMPQLPAILFYFVCASQFSGRMYFVLLITKLEPDLVMSSSIMNWYSISCTCKQMHSFRRCLKKKTEKMEPW